MEDRYWDEEDIPSGMLEANTPGTSVSCTGNLPTAREYYWERKHHWPGKSGSNSLIMRQVQVEINEVCCERKLPSSQLNENTTCRYDYEETKSPIKSHLWTNSPKLLPSHEHVADVYGKSLQLGRQEVTMPTEEHYLPGVHSSAFTGDYLTQDSWIGAHAGQNATPRNNAAERVYDCETQQLHWGGHDMTPVSSRSMPEHDLRPDEDLETEEGVQTKLCGSYTGERMRSVHSDSSRIVMPHTSTPKKEGSESARLSFRAALSPLEAGEKWIIPHHRTDIDSNNVWDTIRQNYANRGEMMDREVQSYLPGLSQRFLQNSVSKDGAQQLSLRKDESQHLEADDVKCTSYERHQRFLFGRSSQTVRRSSKQNVYVDEQTSKSYGEDTFGQDILSQSLDRSSKVDDPLKGLEDKLGIIKGKPAKRLSLNSIESILEEKKGKYILEDLPHPSQLRRKKKERKDFRERIRATDVQYHITQLKRKQPHWFGLAPGLEMARRAFRGAQNNTPSSVGHDCSGGEISTNFNQVTMSASAERQALASEREERFHTADRYGGIERDPRALAAMRTSGDLVHRPHIYSEGRGCGQLTTHHGSIAEAQYMHPSIGSIPYVPVPAEASEAPHGFVEQASMLQAEERDYAYIPASDIHEGCDYLDVPRPFPGHRDRPEMEDAAISLNCAPLYQATYPNSAMPKLCWNNVSSDSFEE